MEWGLMNSGHESQEVISSDGSPPSCWTFHHPRPDSFPKCCAHQSPVHVLWRRLYHYYINAHTLNSGVFLCFTDHVSSRERWGDFERPQSQAFGGARIWRSLDIHASESSTWTFHQCAPLPFTTRRGYFLRTSMTAPSFGLSTPLCLYFAFLDP